MSRTVDTQDSLLSQSANKEGRPKRLIERGKERERERKQENKHKRPQNIYERNSYYTV